MPRAWESLRWPKEFGGLGFRIFSYYNRALITKLGWQLYSQRDKFWVQVIRSKYGRADLVSLPSSSSLSSWWWHGIQKWLPLLYQGLHFSVGWHSVLNCWEDPWVPSLVSFKPMPRFPESVSEHQLVVGNLLDSGSTSWNEGLLVELFDETSADAILQLSPLTRSASDVAHWLPSPDKSFSVKSAYLEVIKTRALLLAILSTEE